MLRKITEFLKKPNLAIWGCGEVGKEIFKYAALIDVKIAECVDSSLDKQGENVRVGETVCTVKSPSVLMHSQQKYNILVTPKENQEIVQMLQENGYSQEAYRCISPEEVRALFINYLVTVCEYFVETMNCKVSFIFFPVTGDIKQPSMVENTLCGYDYIIKNRLEWLRGNPPHVARMHETLPYYSDKYIENIFSGKEAVRRSTGELVQEEHISEYVNVINGMRATTDQPPISENRVHIFGPSIAYGFGVEDRYTLASCLQRLLNRYEDMYYMVLNYGVRGMPLEEYIYKIKMAKICENDHILCIVRGGANKECKEIFLNHKSMMIDLSDYFQRPHDYGEIFFDSIHFSYKGYIAAADIIFNLVFVKEKVTWGGWRREKANFIRTNKKLKMMCKLTLKILTLYLI